MLLVQGLGLVKVPHVWVVWRGGRVLPRVLLPVLVRFLPSFVLSRR